MIDFIKKKLSFLDAHTLEVIKNSSSSTLVNIGGMACGLFVSIFLGQTLGVEDFGVISLAIKVSSVILVFCLLGMKQVIVKETAIGHEQKLWQYIKNVMLSSYVINGTFTVVVSVILIVLSPYIANKVFNIPHLTTPLIIIFISVIPLVFSRIFSSGLIGSNKIWQSNLVDQTLGYLLVGVCLLGLWLFSFPITVVTVALVYAVSRFIITISVGAWYRDILYTNTVPIPTKFIGSKLLKTSLPLLLVGASGIIASNADTIMLGWLGNSEQVGLYVVAARVALLTSFFLQVTNSAISPKIAALYSKGHIEEMEEMVQKITSILFIIAIVPLSLFLFFGEHILSIWGEGFGGAYWILIILSLGQFINLSTGAAGLTLMLCGKERIQGFISIAFVLLNLLLNYFLILGYGAVGAACATAITVAGENITKVILVKNKIGISTIPSKLNYSRSK